MKMQLTSSPDPVDGQLSLIRSMVLHFRTRSLTIADHSRLSKWLDESEANQRLFEKWILETPVLPPPDGGRAAGKKMLQELPQLVSLETLIVLFVVLIVASLLFLLFR